MSEKRVTFRENGTLDEVYSARGAHLEHLGGKDWFLIFYHLDGTESAFWFSSKDLKKPFWEKREKRTPLPTPEKDSGDDRTKISDGP